MRLVFLAILALVLSLSALPQGALAAAPPHGCAAGAGHMAAPVTEAKVTSCAQMALCTLALVPEAVAFAAHFVLQPSHVEPATGLAARRIALPLDLPPPRA